MSFFILSPSSNEVKTDMSVCNSGRQMQRRELIIAVTFSFFLCISGFVFSSFYLAFV